MLVLLCSRDSDSLQSCLGCRLNVLWAALCVRVCMCLSVYLCVCMGGDVCVRAR